MVKKKMFYKRIEIEKGSKEFTFAIIKPNVYEYGEVGGVVNMILEKGFQIVQMNETVFSQTQAELFYLEHTMKDFFEELVEFMTSNTVYTLLLKKEGSTDAVKEFRELMGSVHESGSERDNFDGKTIRGRYGLDIMRNAIHGSDSLESFDREINYL